MAAIRTEKGVIDLTTPEGQAAYAAVGRKNVREELIPKILTQYSVGELRELLEAAEKAGVTTPEEWLLWLARLKELLQD